MRPPSARPASGGSRATAGRRPRTAGWSGSRTTGAPGERSTATTTAGCSARSSTAPPRSSRGGRAAGRPAVRRRGARHVRLRRLERDAVGRAVALPRRDRRGAGQGREGARGVRLPLSGGRVDVRALPRPPHRLPARLPRRLRLQLRPGSGPGRAVAARARRARAGGGGEAGRRAPGRQGGVRAARRCRSAPDCGAPPTDP